MDKNKLCVQNAVTNLDTCRRVVSEIRTTIPNAYFYRSEVDGNYPKGCYLYTFDGMGKVFFNEHDTGSKNTEARQVCKKQGRNRL